MRSESIQKFICICGDLVVYNNSYGYGQLTKRHKLRHIRSSFIHDQLVENV